MPHIVSYECLNLSLPCLLKRIVIDIFYLIHEPLNIFNQDIITSYQHSFLRLG
jgi:hypothetical protein